jgi:hypothetical protein
MIQPLRSIHRRAIYVLALGLPVLLVSSLLARHPEIHASTSPSYDSSRRSTNGFAFVEVTGESMTLSANRLRAHPEILVYWAPEDRATKLDTNSTYLGRLPASESLTVARPTRSGTVLLYSPSTETVIDSAFVGATP